jgi:hypothetical protein
MHTVRRNQTPKVRPVNRVIRDNFENLLQKTATAEPKQSAQAQTVQTRSNDR